jgi:hypothetical protein
MKKANYGRSSFVEVEAPRDQRCACPCSGPIKRKQICFARPFLVRGKQKGTTRIINMDHYDDWLESVAHVYVKTIVDRHPETREYFQ